MPSLLIRDATIVDGTGDEPFRGDVAVVDGRIAGVGEIAGFQADRVIGAAGKMLAPGFIDVHTHDDLFAIRSPGMLPKLSQGVTTVIVGNCGICAAPVPAGHSLPDPMNLLGAPEEFLFPSFEAYFDAVDAARPAINVAALVGHTTLRAAYLDWLDRPATSLEIDRMRLDLERSLAAGALGLSSGLAYLSAFSATTEEVMSLAEPLFAAGGIYTTHMRWETEPILTAMREAFQIGRHANSPVLISHLKCAGIDNWGRASEVLDELDSAREFQDVSCDCYPYAAGSSTLDLRQVDPRVEVTITWSEPHPEVAGRDLREIARAWDLELVEAARRLQPAGAIYHSISEEDMRRILCHPATMVGSDGLPSDPRPHPRLWGTFPRVLGRYCRDLGLMSLATAVRKMTGLPAWRFRLSDRGLVRAGYVADLVLFDFEKVRDLATFTDPVRKSEGIEAVWVGGELAYAEGEPTGARAGGAVRRQEKVERVNRDGIHNP
jgi:N-acyl-D-aspartate/D-glutamate deacylase